MDVTTAGQQHIAKYTREQQRWHAVCRCGWRGDAATRRAAAALQRAHVTEMRERTPDQPNLG